MHVFWAVLSYLIFFFLLLLLARLVIEVVKSFARDWHPSGTVAVLLEVVFMATDPPIKLLRRLIPPIPIGPVRLDLSLGIILFVVLIAWRSVPVG